MFRDIHSLLQRSPKKPFQVRFRDSVVFFFFLVVSDRKSFELGPLFPAWRRDLGDLGGPRWWILLNPIALMNSGYRIHSASHYYTMVSMVDMTWVYKFVLFVGKHSASRQYRLVYAKIWIDHNDATATSLTWWFVDISIPEGPYFRLFIQIDAVCVWHTHLLHYWKATC